MKALHQIKFTTFIQRLAKEDQDRISKQLTPARKRVRDLEREQEINKARYNRIKKELSECTTMTESLDLLKANGIPYIESQDLSLKL